MKKRKEPSVQTTVKFSQSEREMLEKLSATTKKDMSTIIRQFVRKGLKTEGFKQDEDVMVEVITNAVKRAISPSVERLAALSAKTGIMAAQGYFLTALLLERLDPNLDVAGLTVKARKLGINYVKAKDETVDRAIERAVESMLREEAE